MKMMRALSVVLVAGLAVALSPVEVGAFCIGPTVEHDSDPIDRDRTVHLVGAYWGDNCYDTGAPPAGEGTLGHPVTGIEIYLVQDGIEHLVATGAADEEYAFEVDVPVPDRLEPGPVEVIARMPPGPNSYDVTAEPLVISDTAPTGSSDDDVIQFSAAGQGPVTTAMTTLSTPSTEAPASPEAPPASSDTSSDTDDDDRELSPVAVAGLALLVVTLVIGAVLLGRRRTKT